MKDAEIILEMYGGIVMKLMKSTLSWMLALTMVFSLSACGSGPRVEPEAPAVSNQEPGTNQPPADQGDGVQTTELVYSPEGEETTVPAALYTGDGYTIAIPTEGWRQESDLDDGMQEETWESLVNEDVELHVLHLGERDLKAAQTWVIADKEDFQLVEDKQGGLGGSDPIDHEILEVRFHEGQGGMYALMYQYPEDAAEGFGALLSVMADSFTVTK